jgi:hypothetical protein
MVHGCGSSVEGVRHVTLIYENERPNAQRGEQSALPLSLPSLLIFRSYEFSLIRFSHRSFLEGGSPTPIHLL